MGYSEAKRFSTVYKGLVTADRHASLDQLVGDLNYRLPFFFGLYAFDKKFKQVPDFVRHHLVNLTEKTKNFLCYLSILSRYSQSQLPDSVIKKWLEIPSKEPIILEDLFSPEISRLILYRNQFLSIIHPIIAEENLKQLLCDNHKANKEEWKTKLADKCISLIEWIVDICGHDSDFALDIFLQLFISRNPLEEAIGQRETFSELIREIPVDESQNKILETITEYCPQEAHFWNHLGRHHMYVMKSSYKIAEECLNRAKELEPFNDIHYHTLGMVYRNEIHKELNDLIWQKRDGSNITADGALEACHQLIKDAEKCFTRCRELDPASEYGHITHVQLIIEIIERLKRISGDKRYFNFLSSGGNAALWAGEKIPVAEEILRNLKQMQGDEKGSLYTRKCDAKMRIFYDQFESMIGSLQRILESISSTQRPAVRRLIANAYYRHNQNNWNKLRDSDLSNVYQLMSKNIEEGASSFRDLWMWFNAYRRMANFSILEAIRRFNEWTLKEDSLEAHYYLYILYFLNWKAEILKDSTKVIEHIQKCQLLSSYNIRRTFCFEWYAKEPIWCPLSHRRELGDWDNSTNFFKRIEILEDVKGVIKSLHKAPQSGTISLGKFNVFFVPGTEFLPGKDENKEVIFRLGFSYDGFRAWNVKHLEV